MGQRGPLRDPNSRRGVREMPNYTPDAPEKPTAPSWLSKDARIIFDDLVGDLVAADVPLRQVDKHAAAIAANLLKEIQYWSKTADAAATGPELRMQCSQVIARLERDLLQWLPAIGGTTKGRFQLGIRGKKEQKKLGAVASILQAKRGVG